MNVSLSTEFEAIIDEKVRSGLYHSASEVVREALRLLQQRDKLRETKLAQLRADVQRGLDAIDAEDLFDGPETMAAFRKRLLKEKKRRDG
jgi:antitoxin ParD1/3/4